MAPRKKTKRHPKKTRKPTNGKTHYSAKHVKKHLGEWFEKLPTQDWFDFASSQRARLVKEVHHLTSEIINRISDSTIFSNRDEILRDARHHLDSVVNRLNHSDLISRAIHAAKGTRNEILSFLDIPSQKELATLQKRLNQLEKKMTSVKSRTH